jgi:penicillin G amidase
LDPHHTTEEKEMRRPAVRTVLVTVAVLLVLCLLLVSITGFVLIRSPFPRTDGRLELEGLNDIVHVYRDEFGVPHIYAMNEHDLYFAQGFVHAQDRFWQMEFWRHIGQGRISEIVGARSGPGPFHPHAGLEPHGGGGH